MKAHSSISWFFLAGFLAFLVHNMVPHHHHHEDVISTVNGLCLVEETDSDKDGEECNFCHGFHELALYSVTISIEPTIKYRTDHSLFIIPEQIETAGKDDKNNPPPVIAFSPVRDEIYISLSQRGPPSMA